MSFSFGLFVHSTVSAYNLSHIFIVIQRGQPLQWVSASVPSFRLYIPQSDVIPSALTSRGSECHWLRICQSSFQQPWLPSARSYSADQGGKVGQSWLSNRGRRKRRTKQDMGSWLATLSEVFTGREDSTWNCLLQTGHSSLLWPHIKLN